MTYIEKLDALAEVNSDINLKIYCGENRLEQNHGYCKHDNQIRGFTIRGQDVVVLCQNWLEGLDPDKWMEGDIGQQIRTGVPLNFFRDNYISAVLGEQMLHTNAIGAGMS